MPLKQSLQDANGKMRHMLAMLVLQDSGPLQVGAEDLSNLLFSIQYASHQLESHADSINTVKSEISEFHRHLEQMKTALPHLHSRLLAERARLELERRHLNAATHWAEASKGTL